MSREANHENNRVIRILQEAYISCHDPEDLLAIKNQITKLNTPDHGSIPKSELTKIFKVTLMTLNKRIEETEGLQEELFKKFGWTKRRKFLMPGEVELIKKYLGLSPEKTI